ncbi:MAG: DNA-binding CsgD family transcriptional regulator, partial [Reinekea sp.]
MDVDTWSGSTNRAKLTNREQQVLNLILKQLTTGKISERLGITSGTVKTHIRSIFSKLRIHSREEAVSL